jgi:hypothetical protein
MRKFGGKCAGMDLIQQRAELEAVHRPRRRPGPGLHLSRAVILSWLCDGLIIYDAC